MFDKETFCVLPWSSILINTSGDFKVCCFTGNGDLKEGHTKNDDGVVMNILEHSLGEAMNSVLHKEIRIAQSKNEKHPLCEVCWSRDGSNKAANNTHTNSLRWIRSFNQFPSMDRAITFDKVQSHFNEDGTLDTIDPISLDLRFTNICNMKCIMCSPYYSNQWYEDHLKMTGDNNFGFSGKTYQIYQDNGVYKSNMPVWHDSPIWFEKFKEISHKVRHIYMTGGEPFIVKGHETLIDILIESDYAKNIILEYDTNLSVLNNRILTKLKSFKEVIISVSCDDIGDRYELIRFPGKFKKLVENIELIQDKKFKIRHVSTCVGIYSVFAPIRLHNFFSENKKYNQFDGKISSPMNLSVRFLRSPYHSNIAYLPKELKLKVIEVYKNSTISDYWKKQTIAYLNNNMGMSEEKCIHNLKEHVQFLDKLDEIRGTNWRKTFPEVVELIKDYV